MTQNLSSWDWISNPEIWASLLTLTALEIVLGIDNLVFIAILAGRKRLSDFKPLRLVELPDIGPVPCLGLTLIVGPNSAGKTRLLNDLYSRLCGDPRAPVVASRIELNKPEYQPLIVELSQKERQQWVETGLSSPDRRMPTMRTKAGIR